MKPQVDLQAVMDVTRKAVAELSNYDGVLRLSEHTIIINAAAFAEGHEALIENYVNKGRYELAKPYFERLLRARNIAREANSKSI